MKAAFAIITSSHLSIQTGARLLIFSLIMLQTIQCCSMLSADRSDQFWLGSKAYRNAKDGYQNVFGFQVQLFASLSSPNHPLAAVTMSIKLHISFHDTSP
jgi:hypothetical protein